MLRGFFRDTPLISCSVFNPKPVCFRSCSHYSVVMRMLQGFFGRITPGVILWKAGQVGGYIDWISVMSLRSRSRV